MAILTDLPNELLLPIIADVSPLYIEYFLLTCKRIYGLRADVLRAHDLARSSILGENPDSRSHDLFRRVFEDPKLALYLVSWRVDITNCWQHEGPEDLVAEMNVQVLQKPYIAPLELEDSENYSSNCGNRIFPFFITRLLNLRQLDVGGSVATYLVKTVSRIVEVSHDPVLGLQDPLALGRLTEVDIFAPWLSANDMKLCVLLAMIPSLRTLKVRGVCTLESYNCTYQRHPSSVTEIFLGDCVHLEYIGELVRRTRALRKFTYNHKIRSVSTRLHPRLLIELLKQYAKQSLTYLRLLSKEYCRIEADTDMDRNHNDLSMGSLRGFSTLKTLITCVDMFIKTRGHGGNKNRTGTTQRLVSWLPASLETLVLDKGLTEWDPNVLRMLFRGLRNNRRARVPNLRLIAFINFPDFQQLMPDDLMATFRGTGIKIGYTRHFCPNEDCPSQFQQLENGEERNWVAELEVCCRLDTTSKKWVLA